jgi:nicotinamidase-related amidase
MADLAIAPAHTAVLGLDLQAGVVSVYVKDDGFVPRVRQVLVAARRAGVHVVHVKVGFRPGVPEASPRNAFLSAVKASPRHQQFFAGDSGAIHPSIAPEPGDLVVTKTRISAFAGTDLDLLLRASDVDTLILAGVATSGAVLATFLHAFDADYRLVVVGDCCADLDADLHAALVDRFFARLSSVVSAADVERALDASRPA